MQFFLHMAMMLFAILTVTRTKTERASNACRYIWVVQCYLIYLVNIYSNVLASEFSILKVTEANISSEKHNNN